MAEQQTFCHECHYADGRHSKSCPVPLQKQAQEWEAKYHQQRLQVTDLRADREDLRAENAALRARLDLADRLAYAVRNAMPGGFGKIPELVICEKALRAYRASAGGADA